MSQAQRRLAAIMFTDMVGYSALAQRSEELALALLEEHRQILHPLFAGYGGRVIDTMGDGFLVEFPSALQAVRCAMEAQQALGARNASAGPERAIRIRIGIHLGDVVFSEDNVYGDGVNIAARLEPLAEPGGIVISQQVYDQVHTRLGAPLTSIGRPALKNIRTPIEVYRVALPRTAGALAATGDAATPPPAAASTTVERASIAVLPLANLSPDPENEYFSDGLTEDILTQLSRIRRLKVISRTSVMQYKRTQKNVREIGRELGVATVLEGSVRKAGNKVRISVQLIDAGTDEHLWSETYDRELTDIFAIQSDVARQITDALKAQVSVEERARLDHRPTDNMEAYQAYLRGRFLWNQRTDEGVNAAIDLFRRATELDPKYAPAYVGLAEAYIVLGNFGTYRPTSIFPDAKAAALTALELDASLGEAYASLGNIKANYDWDWRGAERAFVTAIELRPSYANAHHWYALYLGTRGRSEEALREIRRARELDPLSPAITSNVAATYFTSHRYDEALAAVDEAIAMHPEFRTAHMYRGWVLLLKRAYADAVPSLIAAGEGSPRAHVAIDACLAYAYAKHGEPEKAVRIATALAHRYDAAWASPVWIAFAYLGLGDRARVFEWLERGLQGRDGWLRVLKTSWFFDEIRETPQYQAVLEKIGLADV
jgi:TolB-like protein/Flp pilus assembly protein TadD